MILDEQDSWHRSVTKLLRTRSQEVIIEAVDTLKKARKKLVEFKPHVIFLDWDLGGEDHGIDLLPDIVCLSQGDAFFKDFPLIVNLTTNINPNGVGFDAGVNHRGMAGRFNELHRHFVGRTLDLPKPDFFDEQVQLNFLTLLFDTRPEIRNLRTFSLSALFPIVAGPGANQGVDIQLDKLAYIRTREPRILEFQLVSDIQLKLQPEAFTFSNKMSEPYQTLSIPLEMRFHKHVNDLRGLFVSARASTLINLAHVREFSLDPIYDYDGTGNVSVVFVDGKIQAEDKYEPIAVIQITKAKVDDVKKALETINGTTYWPHLKHLAWPKI